MSATSAVDREYLPALDGLRAVAIALVLSHNFLLFESPVGVGKAVNLLLNLGWVGVQLFFVLSGFLITRILLADRASPHYYRAFFGRRVLRIFPLYYLSLLVFTLLLPMVRGEAVAEGTVWLWLFVSNWSGGAGLGSGGMPHFWSLAIEEQFYLLWPFVVRRLGARGVLRASLLLALASLCTRVALLQAGASSEAVYQWTPCRFDALALGAALAAFLALPGSSGRLAAWAPRLPWVLLVLALAGFVVTRGYPRTAPLGQTLGYSWLAVVFVVLVAFAVAAGLRGGGHARLLAHPAMVAVGRVSFGMYVLHKPLHDLVGLPWLAWLGSGDRDDVALNLAYVSTASVFTFGVAWLSFQLFERRFLALKSRFPRRSTASALQ